MPLTLLRPRSARPTDRELRGLDRRAELHLMATALHEARVLVDAGWVQHGWFRVAGPGGCRVTVPASSAHLVQPQEVIGACLVGAVVHAAGGVGTQLGRRSIDVVWQTLHGYDEGVGRAVAPARRTLQVQDLTRWNDTAHRRAEQVAALLDAANARTRAASGRVNPRRVDSR